MRQLQHEDESVLGTKLQVAALLIVSAACVTAAVPPTSTVAPVNPVPVKVIVSPDHAKFGERVLMVVVVGAGGGFVVDVGPGFEQGGSLQIACAAGAESPATTLTTRQRRGTCGRPESSPTHSSAVCAGRAS